MFLYEKTWNFYLVPFQGSTSVALYGLGNIRDERLNRMFQVFFWSLFLAMDLVVHFFLGIFLVSGTEIFFGLSPIWCIRHHMLYSGYGLKRKMVAMCQTGLTFLYFTRTGYSLPWKSNSKHIKTVKEQKILEK